MTFADADGKINASTIGDGDITVVGPDGEQWAATLVGMDKTFDGTQRIARFAIAAPGGEWDSGDNGTYTVKVSRNGVRDLEASYVAARTIGTFKVNVPAASSPDDSDAGGVDTTPPTVLWSTFDAAEQTITARFSEDVSRSLNTGDLRLKNLSNSALITYANMTMSYDKETNTAVWSIHTDIPLATYKVMISWSCVRDAAGNTLRGNSGDESTPDHVMYIAPSELAAINRIAETSET